MLLHLQHNYIKAAQHWRKAVYGNALRDYSHGSHAWSFFSFQIMFVVDGS